MALPPVHRIDHPIVWIHETDGAWDRDRIDYELAVLEGKRQPEHGRPVPNGKRSDHPWVRFVNGSSRGDLRTVEEYLAHRDGDLGPTRFTFSRLALRHWIVVRNYLENSAPVDARVYALRLSLTSATGIDLQGGRDGEPLTEQDLLTLRAAVGDSVLESLGLFAIKASSELADAEKKP